MVTVETPADLEALLDVMQRRSQVSMGRRALLVVGLLAGGFVLPGSAGMASFCLSAVAGLAAIAEVAGYVSRNLLIDLLAFHEVIRPRDDCAALLAALLHTTEEPTDEVPEPRS